MWISLRDSTLSFDVPYNYYFWSGDRTAPVWRHIVITVSNDVASAFENGVSIGDGLPQTSSVPINTNPNTDLVIGGYRNDGYSGSIDDLRIYNRVLSAAEVAQLYQYESSCSPHHAVASANVVNGSVVGATMVDGGCGYTNAPLILIQGGGGSGATATAVISDGHVVSINVSNAGCCYTNTPRIVIASPPFEPTVSIRFSKVQVTQHVVLGRNYVLESSSDLITWSPTGPSFTALSETITNEFDIDTTGRFFRIRQVP